MKWIEFDILVSLNCCDNVGNNLSKKLLQWGILFIHMINLKLYNNLMRWGIESPRLIGIGGMGCFVFNVERRERAQEGKGHPMPNPNDLQRIAQCSHMESKPNSAKRRWHPSIHPQTPFNQSFSLPTGTIPSHPMHSIPPLHLSH